MVTLVDVGKIVTDVGLLVAFVLFAYIMVMSRNPDLPRWKSLKFGLAVTTIIWLIPEIAENWVPLYLSFLRYGGEGIGRYIHLLAMAVFAGYVLLRAKVLARA